jgi:hypothetical protein
MGADGATRDQILDHFYPGVGRGSSTGVARVHVAADFGDATELAAGQSPKCSRRRAPNSLPVRIGYRCAVLSSAAVDRHPRARTVKRRLVPALVGGEPTR